MKLTCHILPSAAKPVYFDEAASLYSWTAYELEVICEDFRDYVGDSAVLVLSYSGTNYATATLSYDPTRRDRRVGTLTLVNESFTTLYNLIRASAGTDQARYVKDFSFSITMSSDGNRIVDTAVGVVVMPYSASGYSNHGSSSVVVDSILDGTSANPVQNATITQQFDRHAERLEALEESTESRDDAFDELSEQVRNHTSATDIHVTAEDKVRWNSKVSATTEQREALARMLASPVDLTTSTDALHQRVNDIVSTVSAIFGVTV